MMMSTNDLIYLHKPKIRNLEFQKFEWKNDKKPQLQIVDYFCLIND